MKKLCIPIIIILVIVIMVLVWRCCLAKPARPDVPPQADLPKAYFAFDVQAPPVAVPETLIVYETLPPLVDTGMVEKFREVFGVKGKIEDKETHYSVIDGDREIEIFKAPGTGLFKFCDYSKSYLEKDIRDLPSPEEAVKLARGFLAKNEFLSAGEELDAGSEYFEFAKFDNAGELVEEGKSSITVGFKYQIGDIPFEGPGAKTSITFFSGGEIIEYLRMWRDVKPYREMETVDFDTALVEFKGKWGPEASGRQMEQADILTTVTVDKIYLAYLTRTGSKNQRFVVPVLVFKGYFLAKGEVGGKTIKSSEAFLFTIRAVKDII